VDPDVYPGVEPADWPKCPTPEFLALWRDGVPRERFSKKKICDECGEAFKPSQPDIAYCSEDCREAAAKWRAKFDWAGDVRLPNYKSVRAKPIPKRVRVAPLAAEVEAELARRWQDDGDEKALQQLIGAHRPMVQRIAMYLPRSDIPLGALIEYGMFGLQIAAQKPRPSLTKKGKMVGFNPSLGRFSTYARAYAKNEMMAAITGIVPDAVKPEFFYKTSAMVEAWGENDFYLAPEVEHPRELDLAPCPDPDYWRSPKFEISDSSFQPSEDFIDTEHGIASWRNPERKRSGFVLEAARTEVRGPVINGAPLALSAPSFPRSYHSAGGSLLAFITERLWYDRLGVPYLQRRRWQYCCRVKSTLWNPPDWAKDQYQRPVLLRNFAKHKVTALELHQKNEFYKWWRFEVDTFAKIAKEGFEGWEDGGEDWAIENEFMLATLERSHALDSKPYRLPPEVLVQRWVMGCKRLGEKVKFATNMGLGLFDRRGPACQTLPIFARIRRFSAGQCP
jgi:hypothetical protein